MSLTAPAKITDGSYFWMLLTNALREKAPELSSRIEAMGFPEDAMQMLRFLETLRDFPLTEDVYIILDDFQYVNGGKIVDLITQVVRAAIPCLHLVLLVREYPPLPVMEWEMKGLCYVLTAKTLAFTQQEAEDYLDLIRFRGDRTVRERITQSRTGFCRVFDENPQTPPKERKQSTKTRRTRRPFARPLAGAPALGIKRR